MKSSRRRSNANERRRKDAAQDRIGRVAGRRGAGVSCSARRAASSALISSSPLGPRESARCPRPSPKKPSALPAWRAEPKRDVPMIKRIKRVRLDRKAKSKSKSMTPLPARRFRLFGQPQVLEGEDPAAYNATLVAKHFRSRSFARVTTFPGAFSTSSRRVARLRGLWKLTDGESSRPKPSAIGVWNASAMASKRRAGCLPTPHSRQMKGSDASAGRAMSVSPPENEPGQMRESKNDLPNLQEVARF